MSLLPNSERGEIELTLGTETGIICAEMDRLAKLCGHPQVNVQTMPDLFKRITGNEPRCMLAVLDTLLINGDADLLKIETETNIELQLISEAVLASMSAILESRENRLKKKNLKPTNL